MSFRFVFLLTACLALTVPAWSGDTLSSQEHRVLKNWLARHSEYRQGTDEDFDCTDHIKDMKSGSGEVSKPVPHYHPYIATGDFNGDGVEDFAVVLIDRTKQEKNFALIVFNGPFNSETQSPAFMESGMDLKYHGLFFGPRRPKPYRLTLGRFESNSGSLLIL